MERQEKSVEQGYRYFLGELSEPEQSLVEERFFLEAEYSRFLDRVEEDLIYLYLAGRLNSAQCQNFESRFLISERRRALLFAARETFAAPDKKPLVTPRIQIQSFLNRLFRLPNLAWAGGLAILLITVVASYWWSKSLKVEMANFHPVNQSPGFQIKTIKGPLKPAHEPIGQNERSKPKSIKKELPGPQKSNTAPLKKIISSTDDPLDSKKTFFSRIAENIRVKVAHQNQRSFIKYKVEIHASDGDLLWSREIAVNARNLRRPLELKVRRGALETGNFGLTLSGATRDGQLEEIRTYHFSVEKKERQVFLLSDSSN